MKRTHYVNRLNCGHRDWKSAISCAGQTWCNICNAYMGTSSTLVKGLAHPPHKPRSFR